METSQFSRAIATNALAALPEDIRSAVSDVYRSVNLVNYQFQRLLRLRVANADYKPTQKETNTLRDRLRDSLIPNAIAGLETALGKSGAV